MEEPLQIPVDSPDQFDGSAPDASFDLAQAELGRLRDRAIHVTNQLEAIYAELHRVLHGKSRISLVPEL